MDKFKIVADSSADILTFDKIPYNFASLKIRTDEKEYVDDQNLNTEEMVNYLLEYKGKSSTSCPNLEDWLLAFGDAQYIFCITITSNLSGSYNSAKLAKEMYEEMYKDRKVFVIDSLSTGPEMKLIIEKIASLIEEGKEYEDICNRVTEYCKGTGLLFMLESMKNLARNGRVSAIAAAAAGLLGIRVIGKASDVGTLEQLEKVRGTEKSISSFFFLMKEQGYCGKKVRISHCLNEEGAEKLKNSILNEYPDADIEKYPCRGLCSFYAEKGGMIVGFEK